MNPLASRRFTPEDQQAFARFSGDWNPMHLDPVAARRTQAGEAVIHGVGGLLWALDRLAGEQRGPIARVRAQFRKFIYLDRPVDLHVVRSSAEEIVAELRSDGLTATAITVTLGEPAGAVLESWEDLPPTPLDRSPRVPSLEQMGALSGWVVPPAADAGASGMFPVLCGHLGAGRVLAVAQMSTVVGMACPGLHSIFTELDFEAVTGDAPRPGLGWRAERPDPRYARIDLRFGGSGVRGAARALVRPAPVDPPTMASLADKVSPGEFAGRQALIIGGSRGLGAVTAKLLAAGGARTWVTYLTGAAEAQAVVADIGAAGGRATAIGCDIDGDLGAQLAGALPEASHIYYFATPGIFRQSADAFSTDRFEAFSQAYVGRFNNLCRLAYAARDGRALNVFYPSTVAITDRPRGMAEYAASKAAGEVLCADLVKAHAGLAITAPRLPRVLTDQTASALPIRAADAVDVMLPLLRAERGPP